MGSHQCVVDEILYPIGQPVDPQVVELSPQGFSPTERRRLEREAEKLGPMADAIVTTLLNTGLRISEMTGLSWERIAIGERSGWARINGKGGKFREIPLNLPVRKALLAIRPDPAIGPVYRSRRGPYSPRGVRDLLTELGRRANVQSVHHHRFRHEAARQMIRNGVDLPTVAKILGHKRLETLMIYTQPGPDDLEKAVAALEKL
jgi:integrase